MGQVPAATRALRVLRFLASQPDPVPARPDHASVRAAALTAYHLLRAMIEEGFVVHLAEEHRYGLGVAAFEVGQRLQPAGAAPADQPADCSPTWWTAPARPRTSRCCTAATCSTSWRSARPGRPPLVTDVGVRLPAHLTASGRAILSRAAGGPGARALPGSVGVRRPARHRTAHPERPALPARPRPAAARLRDRGGRGDTGSGERRRAGARPQRAPGRRPRDHLRRGGSGRASPRRYAARPRR